MTGTAHHPQLLTAITPNRPYEYNMIGAQMTAIKAIAGRILNMNRSIGCVYFIAAQYLFCKTESRWA